MWDVAPGVRDPKLLDREDPGSRGRTLVPAYRSRCAVRRAPLRRPGGAPGHHAEYADGPAGAAGRRGSVVPAALPAAAGTERIPPHRQRFATVAGPSPPDAVGRRTLC